MSEEKWKRVVDTVNIPRTMHPSMWPFNDAQEGIAWADAELTRLRSLATRWYLADGTFETLPEEEVIRRRKEAAKTLARLDDVEGMAKVLFAQNSTGEWDALTETAQNEYLDAARALSGWMKGE